MKALINALDARQDVRLLEGTKRPPVGARVGLKDAKPGGIHSAPTTLPKGLGAAVIRAKSKDTGSLRDARVQSRLGEVIDTADTKAFGRAMEDWERAGKKGARPLPPVEGDFGKRIDELFGVDQFDPAPKTKKRRSSQVRLREPLAVTHDPDAGFRVRKRHGRAPPKGPSPKYRFAPKPGKPKPSLKALLGSKALEGLGEGLKSGLKIGGGALATGLTAGGLKKAYEAHKLSKLPWYKKLVAKGTAGRKLLMFGAGAAGIAGGIQGIDSLIDSIKDPMAKKKGFKGMMADNPSLKRENKKDVGRIYNTLFRFNPKMAKDPLVAGSFLKRQLQFKEEGIQPMDIKTLTEVRKNISDKRRGDTLLGSAFLGGAKDLAGFIG